MKPPVRIPIANDGKSNLDPRGAGHSAFSERTGIETWRDFFTLATPGSPRFWAEKCGGLMPHNIGGRSDGGMEIDQLQHVRGLAQRPDADKYVRGCADHAALVTEAEAFLREGFWLAIYVGGEWTMPRLPGESEQQWADRAWSAILPLLLIRGLPAIYFDATSGWHLGMRLLVERIWRETTIRVGIEASALQSQRWTVDCDILIRQRRLLDLEDAAWLVNEKDATGQNTGRKVKHRDVDLHPHVIEHIYLQDINADGKWTRDEALAAVQRAEDRGHSVSLVLSQLGEVS